MAILVDSRKFFQPRVFNSWLEFCNGAGGEKKLEECPDGRLDDMVFHLDTIQAFCGRKDRRNW